MLTFAREKCARRARRHPPAEASHSPIESEQRSGSSRFVALRTPILRCEIECLARAVGLALRVSGETDQSRLDHSPMKLDASGHARWHFGDERCRRRLITGVERRLRAVECDARDESRILIRLRRRLDCTPCCDDRISETTIAAEGRRIGPQQHRRVVVFIQSRDERLEQANRGRMFACALQDGGRITATRVQSISARSTSQSRRYYRLSRPRPPTAPRTHSCSASARRRPGSSRRFSPAPR